MTITSGYATLNEYKAWIAVRGLSGSVGTDTSDDASIEILIEGASRYLDRETGRKFYADSADVTRYYSTDDSECVKIDDLSAAPTSVAIDQSGTRSYTIISAASYDLMPFNALADGFPYNEIRIAPSSLYFFPTFLKGVQVIGKIGFPSVPTDIKEACLAIAQNTYAARSGQSGGGRITVTNAGVVIRPEEVPAMAQKIISHYRNYL